MSVITSGRDYNVLRSRVAKGGNRNYNSRIHVQTTGVDAGLM